jgi:hypothetical protein
MAQQLSAYVQIWVQEVWLVNYPNKQAKLKIRMSSNISASRFLSEEVSRCQHDIFCTSEFLIFLKEIHKST